jgi:hypothetical protein
MFHQSGKSKITLALMALMALMMCATTVCFAGEDKNEEAPLTQTKPQIKEIPGVGLEGDRNFTKEVEGMYDFVGTIDDVQDEGIVVGDSYFKKAVNAKMSGVSPGSRVGMMLNKEGEVVLCEPYKKVRR